jgi:hypothetical protein
MILQYIPENTIRMVDGILQNTKVRWEQLRMFFL